MVEYEDIAHYENEGNGGFHEWIWLDNRSFVDLFEEYLGVNSIDNEGSVKIKAERGIIIIETLAK